MNCPNCGAGIMPGATRCIKCGSMAAQSVAAPGAAQAPTPVETPVPYVLPGSPQKSKLTAGLLGIFFGFIGIHNFYLGNAGRALLQILFTVISCGVAGIWGFIEGILILTGNINRDANGIPLKD